jgi:pyrroloquinoline-quinone synthase
LRNTQTYKAIEKQVSDFSTKIAYHPFLLNCRSGQISLDALRCFLVQHGKYASYFTRYLCALISQLEHAPDVLHLAENLAEELGFGDKESGPPHSQIYASLLRRFDLSTDALPTFPETENQIRTTFMLCRQPEGIAGLGALCLGAEAIVPTIYSAVVQGFRHHGIADKDLDFFKIHIECDDGHAETMYQILGTLTENAPDKLMYAIQAGDIAIQTRLRVYDAIMNFCTVPEAASAI